MNQAQRLISLRLSGLRRQLPLSTKIVVLLLGTALWLFAAWLALQSFAASSALLSDTTAAPISASASYLRWREPLFWGNILLSMPFCYQSLRVLFHRPEWRAYACLPIAPQAIYLAAFLEIFFLWMPFFLLSLALAVPLFSADLPSALSALSFSLSFWLAALLAAPGVHAYAAVASTSPEQREPWTRLAGGWVPAEVAPFLYAPAALLGGLAFSAIPLQRGLEALCHGTSASGALFGLGLSVVAAAVLFVLGRGWYARAFLRVLPALEEADRMLGGGSPLEAEPPYGSDLASLLPRAARPWFRLSLQGLARGARMRWLQLVGALFVGGIFVFRSKALPVWFVWVALAALLHLASTAFVLASPAFGPRWLSRCLSVKPWAIVFGRTVAVLWFLVHLVLPMALLLFWKGFAGAEQLLLLWPIFSLLAASLAELDVRGGIFLPWLLFSLGIAAALPLAALLGAAALVAAVIALRRVTQPAVRR